MEKDIFKGVLLCSDIDGTLTDPTGKISERNERSINRFMELGGLFTVATGRYPDYINSYSGQIKPNTLVIALNGCLLAHPGSGQVIEANPMPMLSPAQIKEAFDVCPELTALYLNLASGYYEITRKEAGRFRPSDIASGDSLFKAVFVSPGRISPESREYFLDTYGGSLLCEQSWNGGMELYSLNAGKGNLVKRLKLITGSEMLVCVGDYENDASMLKAADLGVAVSGAHPAALSAADHVLSSTGSEDALEEAIELTEQRIRQVR